MLVRLSFNFSSSAIFRLSRGTDGGGNKTGENLQISKLKIKNLQKLAQFLMLEIKRFTIHICRYYAFLCNKSFPDAEAGEDGGEDFGGGDFAGDCGEVVEGFADVLADEVA